MPVIRVLIVAPYASARAELHALMAEAEGCAVIGAVSGSAELEALLADARPDVVLLGNEETDGPLSGDRARVVALLGGGEVGLVLLGSGARVEPALTRGSLPGWACLLRDADAEEIAAAVRAVAAGLVVLDRRLGAMLPSGAPDGAVLPARCSVLGRTTAGPRSAEHGAPSTEHASAASTEALTARERDVLQLVAEGLQNRQIAARLYLSPHTVKFHVASILAKLGAASRTEAVTLAARRGELIL